MVSPRHAMVERATLPHASDNSPPPSSIIRLLPGPNEPPKLNLDLDFDLGGKAKYKVSLRVRL